MTLKPDDLADLRRLRRRVLAAVPSWLLLYPCVQLSTVFFLNDRLYEVTLRDPEDDSAFVDFVRREAASLAPMEGFHCLPRRNPGIGEQDERELLLIAMERVNGDAGGRRLQVPHTKYYDLVTSVEELDIALLRRGTAIDREYSKLYTEQEAFTLRKLTPLCEAQAERARFEEPLLPPIKAYAEARQILLRGASRMETTLARYAEVRGWLRAVFFVWIAYSIAGMVCAVSILRLIRRIRTKLKLTGAEPSAGPPTTTS